MSYTDGKNVDDKAVDDKGVDDKGVDDKAVDDNYPNERIERLIVRMLDDEITADERLTLDRELVRSPEARAMLESYQNIDCLSREVIGNPPVGLIPSNGWAAATGRLDGRRRDELPTLLLPPVKPVRADSRGNWMLYASALAACLAMVLYLKTPDDVARVPRPGQRHFAQNTGRPAWSDTSVVPVIPSDTRSVGKVTPVIDRTSPRFDRRTDRDVIFLTDRDGRLYMLEVDRIREVKLPSGLDRSALLGEPM